MHNNCCYSDLGQDGVSRGYRYRGSRRSGLRNPGPNTDETEASLQRLLRPDHPSSTGLKGTLLYSAAPEPHLPSFHSGLLAVETKVHPSNFPPALVERHQCHRTVDMNGLDNESSVLANIEIEVMQNIVISLLYDTVITTEDEVSD
jgi:hypothetical protein